MNSNSYNDWDLPYAPAKMYQEMNRPCGCRGAEDIPSASPAIAVIAVDIAPEASNAANASNSAKSNAAPTEEVVMETENVELATPSNGAPEETITQKLFAHLKAKVAAETKKPEVKKPEVKKPEVKKPEVKKPEVKKPEVKKPEDDMRDGSMFHAKTSMCMMRNGMSLKVANKDVCKMLATATCVNNDAGTMTCSAFDPSKKSWKCDFAPGSTTQLVCTVVNQPTPAVDPAVAAAAGVAPIAPIASTTNGAATA
jgi:hypothetical protein